MLTTTLFPLGQLVATRNAYDTIPSPDMLAGIKRHQVGDWGELDPEDRESNDQALIYGGRVLSVYFSTGGIKFWIITECDRSYTTILLPEDY